MEEIELDTYLSSYATNKSEILYLLKRIAVMIKNVSIESNLSEILDRFLDVLKTSDEYITNGINNLNFAESALLLQASADLYGKKVDLLWDIILDCQQRMNTNENKNTNDEKIDEIRNKRKRKRRKSIETTDSNRQTDLISKFSFESYDVCDYLTQTYDPHDLLNEWNKFNDEDISGDAETSYMKDQRLLFPSNGKIYNMDTGDYIGRHDQLHSSSFIQEIFTLQQTTAITTINNNYVQIRTECGISSKHSHNNCYVRLEMIPVELLKNKIPMPSNYNSLLHNLNCSSSEFDQCNRLRSTEKGHISCSQDSAFYDCDDMDDENDSQSCTASQEQVNTTTTEQLCSNSSLVVAETAELPQEQVISTTEQLCSNSSLVVTETAKLPQQQVILTTEPFCSHSSVVIPVRPKLQQRERVKKIVDNPIKKIPEKQRKLSKKALLRLGTGTTAKLQSFEQFYISQYKRADDEGGIETIVDNALLGNNNDFVEDSIADDFVEDPIADDTFLENSEDFVEGPTDFTATAEHTIENNCDDSIRDTSDHMNDVFEHVNNRIIEDSLPSNSKNYITNEEISRKNVSEWRSFIEPKLRKLENSSFFDIHNYGSKIIESCETEQTRHFGSMMTGQKSSEVARFFISALQLANAGNIEISGIQSGQLSSDSFQITVLNETRHHETLLEYQAPSIESYKTKMSRIKLNDTHIVNHSTPHSHSPSKKMKYSKPKKIL